MPDNQQQIAHVRTVLRNAMPVARKWAYFDHAAVSPIPTPAVDALEMWLREVADDGGTNGGDWHRQLKETRATAAALIGAELDEIALVPNTTAGINLVAEGYPWQPGDNIVTLDDEFPANVYPWLHLESRGVETRRVPTTGGRVDLDHLAAHCDARTRVVSVSWVSYSSGCRRNLPAIAAIAHACGAMFLVDAIQGLGAFPLDVKQSQIDCLSADGHKWLLGPEGAGIAYVSRECLGRLRPVGVGWNSVVHANDYSRIELRLKPSAGRYEGGTYNMPGFLGLGASVRLFLSLGIDNLAASILDFTTSAAARLEEMGAIIHSPWGPDERSGIVSFELPGRDPLALKKHCLTHHVALNCRAGRLRISPHAYNDHHDLERLVAALLSAD